MWTKALLRRASYALLACSSLFACTHPSTELEPALAALDQPRASDIARRVIVVGAGLAGLSTAVDLRAAGWDVLVLEARDRVGGRVHTLHEPLTRGMHAELGGESIDDTHLAIQELVAKYGLALERRPADKSATGVVEYRQKRRAIADFVQLRQGMTAEDYALVSEQLSEQADGLDPEHPEAFADAAKLDRESLAEFIADLGLVPPASFLATTVNRAGFASELQNVSLLFALQQTAAAAGETDDQVETMRITGGNEQLPQALARELGTRVLLSSPVTRIEEQGDHVRVSTRAQSYEAAYAVLAIPPAPMRHITFWPALPDALASAVRQLELGPALKLVSEYRTRFWEQAGESGLVLSEQDFGVAWSASDSYESEHGLLTQFVTGDAAVRWSRLSDRARIASALAQLALVYPQVNSQRIGAGYTLSWLNEPYTRGGYAVYAPTQVTRFFPAFRKGTARLRFAGEHTEGLAGFMESAVRSGHRIAHGLGAPP